MYYSAGPDPAEDRPAHVRAGSGLTWFGGRLAVIQDDANFLAMVDPQSMQVDAVPLPRGAGGLRLFDDLRGNKQHKQDLEVCVASASTLFALGSGSTERRQSVVRYDHAGGINVMDASELYASLRKHVQPLNLEGALLLGQTLRLFNRGDNATIDIDFLEFAAYQAGAAVPSIQQVEHYDLGSVGDIRFGFTDAALLDGKVFFSAAAEATADPVLDGPVHGCAIGVLGEEVSWTLVQNFDRKIEGIAPAAEPRRLWCLVDRDDPSLPSELCLVRLDGNWLSDD